MVFSGHFPSGSLITITVSCLHSCHCAYKAKQRAAQVHTVASRHVTQTDRDKLYSNNVKLWYSTLSNTIHAELKMTLGLCNFNSFSLGFIYDEYLFLLLVGVDAECREEEE